MVGSVGSFDGGNGLSQFISQNTQTLLACASGRQDSDEANQVVNGFFFLSGFGEGFHELNIARFGSEVKGVNPP
jgi:hypothetical protein